MVNFGLLTAEIGRGVWGTPTNFNRFRVLASLLHRRRSMEVNKTLHDVWPSPVLVHYIYIFGLLPAAKFTLRPTLAFSYIASVTTQHSSCPAGAVIQTLWRDTRNGTELSQRAPPIFGLAAITLSIGPYSSLHFNFTVHLPLMVNKVDQSFQFCGLRCPSLCPRLQLYVIVRPFNRCTRSIRHTHDRKT